VKRSYHASKVRHVELTTEMISNFLPPKNTEINDSGRPGLILRGGPSGKRTFYTWTTAADGKRRREKLGRWPTVSLGEARSLVNQAHEATGAEAPSAATVKQIAESYRRNILSNRERGDEAWNLLRVHVVDAKQRNGSPFGERLARDIRARDIGPVIEQTRIEREEERTAKKGGTVKRWLGGPAVARAVLAEIKGMFAHAVGTGLLDMSPAALLQARSFGLHKVQRERHLDAEEIKAFFEALDLSALLDGTDKPRKLEPTTRLGLAFQLYIPLRSHSLIGARWEEFDLQAKRWTVPVARLKLRKRERASAKVRPFVVPLPATAIAILGRLQDLAGSSPYVLASPRDPKRPLERKTLLQALKRLQGDTDDGYTVHDLRRTWRTLAQDLKVEDAVARKSLGHAALDGVEGVYGRSQLVEQRAEAAERVAAALDRIRLGKAAKVTPIAAKRA
jgi:integrase